MDQISARLVLQKGETIKQHLLNIPFGWAANRWEYVGEIFNDRVFASMTLQY